MIHEHRNTRMRNRNLYVLTGGPGGGKSTVLDILDGMGYHTVREAGRKIIRSQAETISRSTRTSANPAFSTGG